MRSVGSWKARLGVFSKRGCSDIEASRQSPAATSLYKGLKDSTPACADWTNLPGKNTHMLLVTPSQISDTPLLFLTWMVIGRAKPPPFSELNATGAATLKRSRDPKILLDFCSLSLSLYPSFSFSFVRLAAPPRLRLRIVANSAQARSAALCPSTQHWEARPAEDWPCFAAPSSTSRTPPLQIQPCQ